MIYVWRLIVNQGGLTFIFRSCFEYCNQEKEVQTDYSQALHFLCRFGFASQDGIHCAYKITHRFYTTISLHSCWSEAHSPRASMPWFQLMVETDCRFHPHYATTLDVE
jgi:hypothetical protein